MPSRNILKVDAPDSYYHIYARGWNRGEIFYDATDYAYFLQLFRRYLAHEVIKDRGRKTYTKLYDDIEVLCYCLLPNHFHLLVYQHRSGTMPRLMRGIMTAYSRYFNQKYERSGSLYETRYRASRISNQSYLEHISRYIHLNPKHWRAYPYSSLGVYLGETSSDWLSPQRILSLFSSTGQYETFVTGYEDIHHTLEKIKHELAGT